MTRDARAVVVGVPHHITQRGNNRQDVFFVDDARHRYLEVLQAKSAQYGLTIHAYCLMTNHVHIVATPEHEDSLVKGIGRTHYFYTRYVNRFHGRSGHLWQNRFFSCPLGESYFLNTVCYVERNPVRARMVRLARRYPRSSAGLHLAGADSSGLLSFQGWPKYLKGERWEKELRKPEDHAVVGTIRSSTFKGHPLGSDRFISKIETVIGRRLSPAPIGRPRKRITSIDSEKTSRGWQCYQQKSKRGEVGHYARS